MTSSQTVALIVAAGRGERAGGDVPKQFQLLAGLPLIEHPRRAFEAHPEIDRVVIVIDSEVLPDIHDIVMVVDIDKPSG